MEETGVVSQYHTEIPEPRVERIEFRIHQGRCRRCRQLVEGRHPRQSSQAVGSAASQLGPRAVALAVQGNQGLGLPYGKTAAVREQGWGLRVSRGGLCQAWQRVARKAEPTYEALRERIRAEPSVTADETGWKVGGQRWWLWACSSPRMTVYAIQPGRGFEPAAAILGEEFAGFLVRDGGSVYRQFAQARHQTCLAHLRRRCREMIPVAGTPRGAVSACGPDPPAIFAATARPARPGPRISPHGLAVARGQLEARLDGVLRKRTRSPANRRLANHLAREREAVFPFLYCPGLEATNWRAEQAIRPMVVTRKVWGGNRTANGARTQSILLSILQTCRQHQRPVLPLLERLLCSPRPRVFDLTTPRPLAR